MCRALSLQPQLRWRDPACVSGMQGEQNSAEYVQMNTFRQVPTLVVGDAPVTQSLAIMEYLEDAYPTPPFLPPTSEVQPSSLWLHSMPVTVLFVCALLRVALGSPDGMLIDYYYVALLYSLSDHHGIQPLERARVRQFSEMINSGIQPLQNLAVLMQCDPRCFTTRQATLWLAFHCLACVRHAVVTSSGCACPRCTDLFCPFRLKNQGVDHTVWAADVIHKGLVGLEALAVETSRGYAVGDVPTIADACLVPQLYNANRFGLDVSSGGDYPTLAAVAAACDQLPAFQQAAPDVQPDADPA
eukprot:COSAG02_NODE_135_length_34565_cov_80.368856_18_plen_300_part_00